jgi:hypothetical protein
VKIHHHQKTFGQEVILINEAKLKLTCSSCGTRPTQHKKAFSYLIQGIRRHIKDSKKCAGKFLSFFKDDRCVSMPLDIEGKKGTTIFRNLL